MLNLLFLLSLFVFVTYIVSTTVIFGVPNSISDTYYLILNKNREMSPLFTFFCWDISLSLLIYWLEINKTDWDLIPFLACSGLMFVGTAVEFNKSLTKEVHFISASLCLLFSYLWSMLYGNNFLAIFIIVISVLCYFINIKNKLFWIELFAFINIFIQLTIYE